MICEIYKLFVIYKFYRTLYEAYLKGLTDYDFFELVALELHFLKLLYLFFFSEQSSCKIRSNEISMGNYEISRIGR